MQITNISFLAVYKKDDGSYFDFKADFEQAEGEIYAALGSIRINGVMGYAEWVELFFQHRFKLLYPNELDIVEEYLIETVNTEIFKMLNDTE